MDDQEHKGAIQGKGKKDGKTLEAKAEKEERNIKIRAKSTKPMKQRVGKRLKRVEKHGEQERKERNWVTFGKRIE